VSGRHPPDGAPPLGRSELLRDLRVLGVREGAVVMVHTSMRSLGWVVGGPDTVVAALLAVVGSEGTVMAYAGWDQDPYHLERWPPVVRDAAIREQPPFDPDVSEANREHGRIPERMRTWPGAVRGPHPEASVVAIGRRAHWIARPHPDDDPYGAGTPLARLVEASGQVLVLGAPLSTLTLLHHAEAIAPIEDKRRVTYTMPVSDRDQIVWRTYHDINTSEGAYAYDKFAGDTDPFEWIARDALSSGVGVSGVVGMSTSYVFPASGLVDFAVAWLVERFGDFE
jgi:aminoglycoside 3-N-acetyltransferase